jgi:hypothetical protein
MNNEIDLSKIDVVYILGKGSTWSDNEIRFSLRSVDINLEHRGVFIIGDKPDFINTKHLTHIPAEDIHTEKLKNALHKLKIACLDSPYFGRLRAYERRLFHTKKISISTVSVQMYPKAIFKSPPCKIRVLL